MEHRNQLLGLVLLAIITSSCSAGFSKPKAESLAEVDGTIHAFIDPDPNRNTDTTVPRQQFTTDGREWFPADDPTSTTGAVVAQPGQDIAMECDERSASCYRVTSPNGGIRLERSADDGATWIEVWSISASRLDFQNRCCGSRQFLIRDLEYVPETGLVAVSLSEYGLLTRGTDAVIRLESLGRPDRPESGLMVGLYMEPLYAAVLALGLGWITAEQGLNRLRNEVERRLGSDDHTWITSRARQVPILPPVMFFVGLGAVVAAVARSTQAAARDQPPARGWIAIVVAAAVIAATSAGGLWLHHRQWKADEETRGRAPYAAAEKKALHAQTMGIVGALMTFVAGMVPLIAWTTGTINAFDDAVLASLAASVFIAGGLWIWEATRRPLPD